MHYVIHRPIWLILESGYAGNISILGLSRHGLYKKGTSLHICACYRYFMYLNQVVQILYLLFTEQYLDYSSHRSTWHLVPRPSIRGRWQLTNHIQIFRKWRTQWQNNAKIHLYFQCELQILRWAKILGVFNLCEFSMVDFRNLKIF